MLFRSHVDNICAFTEPGKVVLAWTDNPNAPVNPAASAIRTQNKSRGNISCPCIIGDGEGTILTTEACLLSAGRNPELSKEAITQMLCDCLGAEKVIWLPCGIYQDETNEHVDNICAFTEPGKVVLAWTDNPNDPQYECPTPAYRYWNRKQMQRVVKFR